MNDVKKYVRMVRQMFPVYGVYERRFYSDFERNIAEYAENHKDVRFSDLERKFGPPTMVIQEYLENTDTSYLFKQLSRTRHIKIACCCAITGIICSIAIWGASYYFALQAFRDNLPEIQETTVHTFQNYGGNK